MTKTISATKKMLAMILAMLMMLSGMAVSASAGTTDTTDTTGTTTETAPTVPVPTVVLNETDKKLIVTPPTVEGYEVSISVSPLPSDPIKAQDGSLVYINLVEGKTYIVKAYISYNGSNKYSQEVTKTLKQKQSAPAAPVPSKVTSTTITVAKVTGCEYKLEKGSTIVSNWSDKVVYEGLTANTPYVLSIRKAATSTKYASDAVSITVKTLKSGEATPVAKPVLVDKTNTTIVVKEVENVQFSIDRGNTWQTSGTFSGLTPNTIYGIIARKTFDPAVQDPNPVSEILEIRTNSRVRYAASVGKCTFTVAEGTIYAEKEIQVTVTGDGPEAAFSDMYNAEYGDTWFIPYQVKIGDDYFDLTRSSANTYTGYIAPDKAFANKDNVEVEVIYTVKRFNGEQWIAEKDSAVSKHKINVGAEWGVLTVIAEFFTKAANLLLNTIPQFLTDLFGSEASTKFFEGIVDFLGKIGKPTT